MSSWVLIQINQCNSIILTFWRKFEQTCNGKALDGKAKAGEVGSHTREVSEEYTVSANRAEWRKTTLERWRLLASDHTLLGPVRETHSCCGHDVTKAYGDIWAGADQGSM